MSGAALVARFLRVRGATEALAEPLSAEDQLLQSTPESSPTKWHRAHTTWFFEEFVLAPRGRPAVDPRYRYLFNSYYEAVGPRHPRPKRGLLSRPSVEEIGAYRRAVDGRVVEVLETADAQELFSLAPILLLGLAHEEQHQELLLTDLHDAFWANPLRPALRPAPASAPAALAQTGEPAELRWLEHPGGLSELGAPGAGFAFDNEGPRHRVFLEPFALASRPIGVAEVLAFVEAGGYQDASLWLSDGWARVRDADALAPAYARVEGGRLVVFGADGEREADPAEPASHLTFYEADALARFLGARLPSEAEWEHAARGHDSEVGNFVESGAWRPLACPDAATSATTSRGPSQLFGDVWEWTASAYGPYPGFRPAAGAIGEYNAKFMVSQLVLRGGSCFTPRGHLRPSYRNFWPPATHSQVTGARLARSLEG